MGSLRELLSGLGLTEVRSHLQSGNAVFGADQTPEAELALRIEAALTRELGLTVRCLLRTANELREVVAGNALLAIASNPSWMMALLLSAAPDLQLLAAHDPRALAPEQIQVGERVIYQWGPQGVSNQWGPQGVSNAPPLGPFVERHLKVAATARNWKTVTKLAWMLGAGWPS